MAERIITIADKKLEPELKLEIIEALSQEIEYEEDFRPINVNTQKKTLKED